MSDYFVEALNCETNLMFDDTIKKYYINNFFVNRAEFLLRFGEVTKDDVKLLRTGKEIEKDEMVFRVENWDAL